MFFDLPIEIQVKILREYVPSSSKYKLLEIKPFHNLLKNANPWLEPITLKSKNRYLCHINLLSKIKTGYFTNIESDTNSIYRVCMNYKYGYVIISEYFSSCDTQKMKKKVCYSTHDAQYYLSKFYELNNVRARKCSDFYKYRDSSGNISFYIFNFRTLRFPSGEKFKMFRCCPVSNYYTVYRSENYKVFLVYNILFGSIYIFIINLLKFSPTCICKLLLAYNVRNEYFQLIQEIKYAYRVFVSNIHNTIKLEYKSKYIKAIYTQKRETRNKNEKTLLHYFPL